MSWQEIISNALTIRRKMHSVPEPAWDERHTSLLVTTKLDSLNIPWRTCAKTGIVAYIAQQLRGGRIAFRTDMDGLLMEEQTKLPWQSKRPGCMHACGHDGHMATMLAAAEWLKRHEGLLSRPVVLLFQPAEEGGFGAKEMIADGALEGVERIYGWHNWPTISFGKAICPAGPVMAANASFHIVLRGQGGHASQPEACRDPVLGAAALTMGLQQIVSRRLAPNRAGVVSVTSIDARSGETIIPQQAELSGSVRTMQAADMKDIGIAIESISHGIAAAHDLSATVDFSPRYPAVINDAAEAARVQSVLADLLGSTWECTQTPVPVMASEDFSYYLEQVPGAFALVGAGEAGTRPVPCHNAHYDFNDQLLEPMAKTIVSLAGLPII